MDYLNPLRLLSVLCTLELMLLSNGTESSADRVCPVIIIPERMVIQYNNTTQTAQCQTNSTASINEKLYWVVEQGTNTEGDTWKPDTQKDWDPQPTCTGMFNGIGKCKKPLDYTLYKKPDSVSILVDKEDPVVEAEDFQLRCDITNVAPARNLTVRWYIGNVNYASNETMEMTGCSPLNKCDFSVRSPMNISQTIYVRLNKTNNGAEIKCEAVLELGENGPNPPPSEMSSPINITVHYKPNITTELSETIPLFRGYPEDLVCTADGNPSPKIQWFDSQGDPVSENGTLKVNEAGVYNCNASNEVGWDSYAVTVILKEDYLPLIAGFVAVAVVAISIVFLFIYSIYYKNTKMRQYNLKNAKLSTHNGNVAHNGWDMQFPMTKLS